MPRSRTSRSSSRRVEAGPRGIVALHLRRSQGAAAECVRRLWSPPLDGVPVHVERDPDGVPWGRVGKRRLPLSLSHADGYVAAAAHLELRVGVDLEPLRALRSAQARYFLTPDEEQALGGWDDPATAALAGWVVKEAVLKARGRGLCDPPGSVRIRSMSGRFVDLAEPGSAAGCWREGDHVVAVACIGVDELPPIEVSHG